MKYLFFHIIFLPCLCFSQKAPELKSAQHTFNLQGDSLTVFSEAEFYSIVDWYVEADTTTFLGSTISLDIYYKPRPSPGTWPFTSTTKDTLVIDGLSTGSYTLVVNSYEWSADYDSSSSSFYEFFALRDSDTSHFQVLSDGTYLFKETPLNFYPNPASDFLNVEGLKAGDGTFSIFIIDIQGREILRSSVSHENSKIRITDLPEGLYLLRVNQAPLLQKIKVR